MLCRLKWLTVCLLTFMATLNGTHGQTADTKSPDLTREPTLYVVGYAHLDTEWRWDYPTTIRDYLTKTMRLNFDLFEKYPHYIFNFSGSNRYRMMHEYYPDEYRKVKDYVAAGRWFPCGSSVEESDVNSPSAESLIRQILYGTHYFLREFGKTSAEYMLPDCFGFPASLPSILAHTGIKGFSTQKLTWNSAAQVGGPDSPEKTPPGVPFNIGIWEGLDGKSVIAALNPGSYTGQVNTDLTKSPEPTNPSASQPQQRRAVDWPKRIQLNGTIGGLFTDYMYYGTGDTGGSPSESSVKLVEAIVTKSLTVLPSPQRRGASDPAQQAPPPPGPEILVGDGPLRVVSATAEQMFLDIKPDQTDKLPRYKGDLELTNHSAGSLTSQAYMKRWNRQNEVMAEAAEKASVAADWLGNRLYPRQRLNDAWTLVMGGQFHDIIPGTSIPKAYEYAWNDEVLAMNQFAGVLTSAVEAVASAMDTRVKGIAVLVYNPLNISREDVVEAEVSFGDAAPKAVRVFGPDGKEVPAQLNGKKVLFLAKTPSIGFAVYDVRTSETIPSSGLNVTESSLENARYRICLDSNGDVSGIFDKAIDRELLSAPVRLEISTDKPVDWPAWNMDWSDQQKAPRAYVQGPAKVRIVENGPVRVAVRVERNAEGSRFVQTIRLAAGDAGNRVEFGNVIEWKTAEANLKAAFRLTASNSKATYNWDIGTIERTNNDERKFEVPSHQWFDLTDKSGSYGVAVLSDCKNASDKPDDNTLRLTLLRTPGIGTGNGRSYSDQSTQDWGRHEFVYGLAGHAGDWRRGVTDWQALRLNQPLFAFESSSHKGSLGKTFSLLNIDNRRVRVLAIKKAEQSDEMVVRLVEMDGAAARNVRLAFAAPVAAAREINGAEMPLGTAVIGRGALMTDFEPYQPRTFAVKLSAPRVKQTAPLSQPLDLPYDQVVASKDHAKTAGGFDTANRTLPAEMLPEEISFSGIRFKLASSGNGKPNAMTSRGQSVLLPEGNFTRIFALAASRDGDQEATFRIGDRPVTLTIQDWSGYIGQWDNRTWNRKEEPVPPRPDMPAPAIGTQPRPPRMRTVLEYTGLTPGFIKRSPVAWFASHRHTADRDNDPYAYCYLFAYSMDISENAKSLTLPDNDNIRILAITISDEGTQVYPAHPLYDTLERNEL